MIAEFKDFCAERRRDPSGTGGPPRRSRCCSGCCRTTSTARSWRARRQEPRDAAELAPAANQCTAKITANGALSASIYRYGTT